MAPGTIFTTFCFLRNLRMAPIGQHKTKLERLLLLNGHIYKLHRIFGVWLNDKLTKRLFTTFSVKKNLDFLKNKVNFCPTCQSPFNLIKLFSDIFSLTVPGMGFEPLTLVLRAECATGVSGHNVCY
jgi:hypothetical protein